MAHSPFSNINISLFSNTIHLIGLITLISCLPTVSAFGSGNIPSAAYLKGKAWRHGDIEDTLEGLTKVAGQGGSAIVGAIASALLGSASGGISRGLTRGKKFTGLDVKRIYFGNWLRDLSQVCDIAGFKAMTPESLVICIMTMGFLSFGYATREFQVTRERLSVYLLTEHIDNPKGYAEGEDPRKYDPRLRPPVDEARELRIDERNGMKMYIASDDQGFDTSTACVRRVFRKCIELGRQAQREGNQEKEHESFRLLGTGLHTLEDFSAHSNWCELALQKLGHKEVFAHVGENVKVNSPEGPVPPLVTGTFAGADFCFSMLGEAGDKLSSASIADLTAQLDTAQSENNKPGGINLDFIKSILSKLPVGGNDSEVQHDLDSMDEKKHAFDLDGRIDQIAPEELQSKIWELFKVRDNLMRRIEEIIQGIPGLGEMLEKLSLSLAQWIMVTIDPFVRPILVQASCAIGKGSEAVISGNDQWTVFNDPNASDPTHSVLAKDHFSNILNDPAGNISVIIVKYTVNLIVEAWSNDENPDHVINRILEAIHHPNYFNRNSTIQREMFEYMQRWLNEMERDDRELTIKSLTKDSVRNHRNQRKTSKGDVDPRLNGGASSHGHSHPAYRQSSMLGSSRPENQHGCNSQSDSAGYPYHPHPGGQSKYGDSQSKSQYSNYQSQSQYTGSQLQSHYAGSQSGDLNHYDNIRKTESQSDYASAGQNSSLSGRFNKLNMEDEYRNNSAGYGQGNHVRMSHNQNPESLRKKSGGAYEPATERRDQYSSNFDEQSEKTLYSHPSGLSPGRDNYSHGAGRETGYAHNSEPDRRDPYSSTYGHQPEQISHSRPYTSSTGHQKPPRSGYGYETTPSAARTNDYEQGKYNQSRPSFPEPVESTYDGRIGFNTLDRPGSEYGSPHSAHPGSHQPGYRPAFPQADYGGSQSNYGRSNADFGRGDYNSDRTFPNVQHNSAELGYQHDDHRDNGSQYGNRYADTGFVHDTNYSGKHGDSAHDQVHGPRSERRTERNRSHSREDSHRKHSEDPNRRHRNHSEDSDDSDDSKGKQKHKHKHDKPKKERLPDSWSGSHFDY